MASKVSKRKRPSKDKYLLKEKWKLEDAVFDKYTLITISNLMKKNLIQSVDFPISRGKEANVYRVTSPKGNHYALKIFRIETTRFFKKQKYIIGDPRFTNIKKDRKNLAFIFTQKEFKNLRLAETIGLSAPRPIMYKRNVILMTYLGKDSQVYPQLIRAKTQEGDLEFILDQIKLMYKNKLVHSDLSAYNILVGDKIYLIDFAQGVVEGHPHYEKFLERDVENVLAFFKRKKDLKKTLEWIRS